MSDTGGRCAGRHGRTRPRIPSPCPAIRALPSTDTLIRPLARPQTAQRSFADGAQEREDAPAAQPGKAMTIMQKTGRRWPEAKSTRGRGRSKPRLRRSRLIWARIYSCYATICKVVAPIAQFLITMFVSILDPIAAVGYILAAIFAPYWWQAVAAASLWAICTSLPVSALNSEGQAYHWNTTYPHSSPHIHAERVG